MRTRRSMPTGRPPGERGRGAPVRAPRGAADRHGRRPARDRGLHPGPAPPGGLRACRAGALGRHRLGARRLPRRGGDRSGAAPLPDAAVPDLVAGLAGGRRGGGRAPRMREPPRRHQPDRGWLLRDGGRDGGRAGRRRPGGARGLGAAPRQLHGPGPDDGPVRRLGLLGRARRGHRQQDRVADRLHDPVRRQRLRLQPGRRPLQDPGAPALAGRGRPRRDRAQGAVGRPLAGPDRRGGGRLHLPRARPPPLLDDRPAPERCRARRRSGSTRRSWRGSSGWWPGRSSSARCRRSRSWGRARPASTTCTRAGGRAAPDREARDPRRAPRRSGPSPPDRPPPRPSRPRQPPEGPRAPAVSSSWRPRSATSATSRCGRSRSWARCRWSRPRTPATRAACSPVTGWPRAS